MTAKKKVVKRVTKKPEIKEESKSSYTPIFPPIDRYKSKKVDLNYYGIKQKLKKIGFDFFKKVKEKKEKPPKISLWQKYCNWWNNKFNPKWDELA